MVSSSSSRTNPSGWLFLSVTAIAVFTATLTTTKLQDWANRAAKRELQLS